MCTKQPSTHRGDMQDDQGSSCPATATPVQPPPTDVHIDLTDAPPAGRQDGGPATKPSRLVGVDAARGIALLGMMSVHALWAYDENGDVTWTYALAAGRSAATFALLAGVAIAFMTRRRRAERGDWRTTSASLAARAGVVGVIGLLLGGTDAAVATVIFTYYAVLFIVAIPMVFLSTRALFATGSAIALVVPVLSHLVRPHLPESADGNVSVAQLLQDPVQLLTQLTLTGLYPALPWMAYVCIGIAIGRLQLSAQQVALRLFGWGAGLAISAWALSFLLLGPAGGRAQLYASGPASGRSSSDIDDLLSWGGAGSTPTDTWWWLATVAPHTTTPLDLAHTIGVATALLGGMLLLARRYGNVLTPLAAAGGMTLTLYTAHVLFLNSPWDVFGATTGYVIQVAAALAFAVIWRKMVGSGPLEALAADTARAARRAAARRERPAATSS